MSLKKYCDKSYYHQSHGALDARFALIAALLPVVLLCGIFLKSRNGPGIDSPQADCASMSLVPDGAFQMGVSSGIGAPMSSPRHKISLSAFYMDKCEVTVAQYAGFAQAVGKKTPPQPPESTPLYPVLSINWHDADAYCKWAGKRLPTEAQWEKAARGGSDTGWHFGTDNGLLAEYAWYGDNSGGHAHPVGQKRPNQYGLYDMAGNAGEWCADFYSENYYKNSPRNNPEGPANGSERVLRGGSWGGHYVITLPFIRKWLPPGHDNGYLGFRCAKPQ